MTVAKAFQLGRGAVSAGNYIPIGWISLVRPPGPRIDDDDAASLKRREVDPRIVGGRQRSGRQHHTRLKMRGSVIDWSRKAVAVRHLQPLSRMRRPFWRSQSRFFSVSRLSCSFLPLARPSSTLAIPRALK